MQEALWLLVRPQAARRRMGIFRGALDLFRLISLSSEMGPQARQGQQLGPQAGWHRLGQA
jgi:hypothetical protein